MLSTRHGLRGHSLGDKSNIELETLDERTIRLLNEEVLLLRTRATEADDSHRRLEAIADAAAKRFAEQCGTLGKEITLLRKRVTNSHERERALKAAAEISSTRFSERGDLLNEVNHRAKNSIQIAMSVLNLQRQANDDPQVRVALASAVERLSHVARVHSMLYMDSPDQQTIDFGDYLKTFCAELREALAGDVEMVCGGAEELNLDASRAITLALITSEAVTNALKHAFPDGRQGTIAVDCCRRDGQGILAVRDSGIGLTDERRENAMGLKLIRTLVKSIGGKLHIDSAEGTSLQVTFPL
jgi:two-component sensor histidine kinase